MPNAITKQPYVVIGGKEIPYSEATPAQKAQAAFEAGKKYYGITAGPQEHAAAVALTAAKLYGGPAIYQRVEEAITGEVGLYPKEKELELLREEEKKLKEAELRERERQDIAAAKAAEARLKEQQKQMLIGKTLRQELIEAGKITPLPETRMTARQIYERHVAVSKIPQPKLVEIAKKAGIAYAPPKRRELEDVLKAEEKRLRLRSQAITEEAGVLAARAEFPFYTSAEIEKFTKEREKLLKEAEEFEREVSGFQITAERRITALQARLPKPTEEERRAKIIEEKWGAAIEKMPVLGEIRRLEPRYQARIAEAERYYETQYGRGVGALLRVGTFPLKALGWAARAPEKVPEFYLKLGAMPLTAEKFVERAPAAISLVGREAYGAVRGVGEFAWGLKPPSIPTKAAIKEYKAGLRAREEWTYEHGPTIAGFVLTSYALGTLAGAVKAKVAAAKLPSLAGPILPQPAPYAIPKGAKLLSVKQAEGIEFITRKAPLYKGDVLAKKVYVAGKAEITYLPKGAEFPVTKVVAIPKTTAKTLLAPTPTPLRLRGEVISVRGVRTPAKEAITVKLTKLVPEQAPITKKWVFAKTFAVKPPAVAYAKGKYILEPAKRLYPTAKLFVKETPVYEYVKGATYKIPTREVTKVERLLLKTKPTPYQYADIAQIKGRAFVGRLGFVSEKKLGVVFKEVPAIKRGMTLTGEVAAEGEKRFALLYKLKKPPAEPPYAMFKPTAVKHTPFAWPEAKAGAGMVQLLKTKTITKAGVKAITVSPTELVKYGPPAPVSVEIQKDIWGKPTGYLLLGYDEEEYLRYPAIGKPPALKPVSIAITAPLGITGLISKIKPKVPEAAPAVFQLKEIMPLQPRAVTPITTALMKTREKVPVPIPAVKALQIQIPRKGVGITPILVPISIITPKVKYKIPTLAVPEISITEPTIPKPKAPTPPTPVPPTYFIPEITPKKKPPRKRKKVKKPYGIEHIPIPALPLPYIGALEIKGLTPIAPKFTRKELKAYRRELKLAPAFAGETLAVALKKRHRGY